MIREPVQGKDFRIYGGLRGGLSHLNTHSFTIFCRQSQAMFQLRLLSGSLRTLAWASVRMSPLKG